MILLSTFKCQVLCRVLETHGWTRQTRSLPSGSLHSSEDADKQIRDEEEGREHLGGHSSISQCSAAIFPVANVGLCWVLPSRGVSEKNTSQPRSEGVREDVLGRGSWTDPGQLVPPGRAVEEGFRRGGVPWGEPLMRSLSLLTTCFPEPQD